MTELVRKLIPGRGWQTIVDTGRQTQTQTVTTDPDTFIAEATFDLGGATMLTWTLVAVGFDPDGETFGDQPGDIQGEQVELVTSIDGITWTSAVASLAAEILGHSNPNGGLSAPGQYLSFLYPSFRYARLSADVADFDFFPYAGPNHPTITYEFTVEYAS